MVAPSFDSSEPKLHAHIKDFATRAEQHRVLAECAVDKGWRDVYEASASAYEAWTAALQRIAKSCESIQRSTERIRQSRQPADPQIIVDPN